MKRTVVEHIGVLLLMTLVGVAASWPLVEHFFTAIPCQTTAGRLYLNRPGDNLQLLYWFWLLKDNLFGPSGFMQNPYEFNVLAGQSSGGLYMYPLNFLYLLFSPLGDIAAYNSLVLCSYSLTGFFTYLLVRLLTGSRSGALLGALIYTLVPIRIINMMGGHLNGFIYFLLPAIVYFLEKSLRTRRLGYGVLCGLAIFWLSLLEVHLIYYVCVFLGVYIPFRLLCFVDLDVRSGQQEYYLGHPLPSKPDWWSSGRLLGIGLCLTVFYQALVCWKYQTPFVSKDFFLILGFYPMLFLLSCLLTASLIENGFGGGFRAAVRYLSYILLPLCFLALHALNLAWRIEGLDKMLSSCAAALVLLLAVLARKRSTATGYLVPLPWSPEGRQRIVPLLPVGLGLLLSVAWVLAVKKLFFAGSIAHGGRTIQDVKLFSPVLEDLYTQGSEVYFGLVPLVLILYLFIVLVRQTIVGREVHYGRDRLLVVMFFACSFFLAYLLGSGLSFGSSSLYTFFFNHFPFFNYPRVPDRIMTIAFLCGAVLIGFAVDDFRRRHWQPGNRMILFGSWGFLLWLVWFDYGAGSPVALTNLDRGQEVYRYVKNNIGDGLLMELPLWPGDSHQSSLYEYYITLDGLPRVNGYTPIVTRKYIEETYKPLSTLNMGILDRNQYEKLRTMGIRFLTVHNNPDVFPSRVSPFPPLMTVRRLMQSPYLEYVALKNTIELPGVQLDNPELYLFKVREDVGADEEEQISNCGSIMPSVYPATRLGRITGKVEVDPSIGREVSTALKGRDREDYLSYGPYEEYSPGVYTARFRLRGDRLQRDGQVANLEISAYVDHGAQELLAERKVYARDLREGNYTDIVLYFTPGKIQKLEFRTWFSGTCDLRLEKIVVSCAMEEAFPARQEAQNLLGETGFVIADPQASGGSAVEAQVERDAAGRAVYGPFATYPSGRYAARFFLKAGSRELLDPSSRIVATVTVTADDDATVLGSKAVTLDMLPGNGYHNIPLDFHLSRPNELSFNIYFHRQVDLLADRIDIVRFGPEKQMPPSSLLRLLRRQQRPGEADTSDQRAQPTMARP